MDKKVLVISYTALMASTPNGRTMQSLLQGVPSENISLFCCYGLPDMHSCQTCYKISNKDALRLMIHPSKYGQAVDMQMSCTTVNAEHTMLQDQRKGDKKAWKYLAKELVWAARGWRNAKFQQWLNDQNYDCVVYMYGDSAALQNLAVYAAEKKQVPLIVYSCEDYCLKDYNYIDKKKWSISFFVYRLITNHATKCLFKRASWLITNSEKLGREYKNKYGLKNVSTVMMASQMAFKPPKPYQETENIHIDYLGALGHYRIKALVEIGNALQNIDTRLKLNVYGRVQNESHKQQLEACKGIQYHGFVPYEKVQEIMYDSTLLIEAISDDPYVKKSKRYGFSTKYADCFACGTPLLVYAPDDIIETEFAREHDCAFVASTLEELPSVLRDAIYNSDARMQKLKSAQYVTNRFFSVDTNIDTVNRIIDEAVAQR